MVADPGSPLLAARKPQSSLELRGSNRELWGALHAPDLPDPDCYFPLFLISYLIMTLPQVCSAEVSLNALLHAKGQRGINQHPRHGSRRAESRGAFWPRERARGLVLNLGRVAELPTGPTLSLSKENAESPGDTASFPGALQGRSPGIQLRKPHKGTTKG